MEKPPKMYNYEQWLKAPITTFNVDHGTNYKDYTQLEKEGTLAINDEVGYESYKEWFIRKFSKLGRALE